MLAATGDEPTLDGLKGRLRDEVERDPVDAVFRFTLGAAWLFYDAEREENPKVESYLDALMYIATSLNVGYHEIHPRTEAGKAIAAVVHVLGPSLAAGALRRRPEDAAAPVVDDAVVSRLDAILDELRALRASPSAAPHPHNEE